ncbi:MAG: hypothetical protein NTW56_11410 [Alphaproteobacteria bacterium]|nr:hypothetical protein [Alphaproteobacteria bacterium]
MPERAAFHFHGRLVPASFEGFARHRAARLGLVLDMLEVGHGGARAVLHGPRAMLDAFEMACMLGPIDCLVSGMTRED